MISAHNYGTLLNLARVCPGIIQRALKENFMRVLHKIYRALHYGILAHFFYSSAKDLSKYSFGGILGRFLLVFSHEMKCIRYITEIKKIKRYFTIIKVYSSIWSRIKKDKSKTNFEKSSLELSKDNNLRILGNELHFKEGFVPSSMT